MTKKYIKRAEADLGLIFTTYNLRRLINIMGIETLQNYLKEVLLQLFITIHNPKEKIRDFKPFHFLEALEQYLLKHTIGSLIFAYNLT